MAQAIEGASTLKAHMTNHQANIQYKTLESLN